jgi:hypothetical protein
MHRYFLLVLIASLLSVIPASSAFGQWIDWAMTNGEPQEEYWILDEMTYIGFTSTYDGYNFTPKLARSTDAGDTWTSETPWGESWYEDSYGIHGTLLTDLFFHDSVSGWAFGEKDKQAMVYRTIDGGKSWSQVSPSISAPERTRFELLGSDDASLYFASRDIWHSGPHETVYQLNRSTATRGTLLTPAALRSASLWQILGISSIGQSLLIVGRDENDQTIVAHKYGTSTTLTASIIDTAKNRYYHLLFANDAALLFAENRIALLSPKDTFDVKWHELPWKIESAIAWKEWFICSLLEPPYVIALDRSLEQWSPVSDLTLSPGILFSRDSTVIHDGYAQAIHKGTLHMSRSEVVTASAGSFNARLLAYPNPASSSFSLEMGVDVRTVRVIDALGKTCIETVRSLNLDVSQLSTGIYTVEAATPQGLSRTKLVIQR